MPTQSIQTVEHIIKSSLKALGYFKIVTGEHHKDSLKILADGKLRNIFLEVVIAGNTRKKPGVLSHREIRKIKSSAAHSHREPWTAVVTVDKNGDLADSIKWTNLSNRSIQPRSVSKKINSRSL